MRYAIITPSFRPDFERCQLLVESTRRYVRGDWTHHIVVDRSDEPLFRSLADDRTRIAVKEDWMPWWIRRMPFSRRWWLSLKSLPVRGWIVQQLIKVGVGEHIDADAYVFVDSDLAFVRPFDLSRFEINGRLRLFRAPGAARTEEHFRWHRTAARLLGLPVRDYFGATYIGAIVTWRRDHLCAMYDHIRSVTGQSWFLSVARQLHFAEYMLYGIYVEHVLGPNHRHEFDDSDIALISWEHAIDGEQDLDRFFAALKPEQIAVMLSSKLNIPVERYRDRFPFQPVD